MIIQGEDNDDVNEGDSDGGAFISICQLDLTDFAAMRKAIEDFIITLGLSNWKNAVAICSDRRGYERSRFGVSIFKSPGLSCYI